MSASAQVNTSCTSTTTGSHTKCQAVGGRKISNEIRRIGSPRKKCTMFASTLTIGRISAGNRTFLIKLPPAMSAPDASISDEENHVHGKMPQNMNREYGCTSASRFGKIVLKMNE